MNQITNVLHDTKRLRLIACALELLQCEGADSAVIPAPGTEPPRYVAIGTAATVARLLEVAQAATAAPVQAATINSKEFRKLVFAYTEALFGANERDQAATFKALVSHIDARPVAPSLLISEQAVRDQALREAEEAAEKVRDQFQERDGGKWPELRDDAATGAGECVDAIRALRTTSTAQPSKD